MALFLKPARLHNQFPQAYSWTAGTLFYSWTKRNKTLANRYLPHLSSWVHLTIQFIFLGLYQNSSFLEKTRLDNGQSISSIVSACGLHFTLPCWTIYFFRAYTGTATALFPRGNQIWHLPIKISFVLSVFITVFHLTVRQSSFLQLGWSLENVSHGVFYKRSPAFSVLVFLGVSRS